VLWLTSSIDESACRAFNAHALGALAEVAGPGLNVHLSTLLPPLIFAMGGDDEVMTITLSLQPIS